GRACARNDARRDGRLPGISHAHRDQVRRRGSRITSPRWRPKRPADTASRPALVRPQRATQGRMHRATVGMGLSHRDRPARRPRNHRHSVKVEPNARGLVRATGFGYATQPHMRRLMTLASLALLPLPAWAASERIAGALETELQPPAITTHQITQYLARRTPTPPVPWTSADWGAEARRLRRRLLEDVVLHGWPREWVNAPTPTTPTTSRRTSTWSAPTASASSTWRCSARWTSWRSGPAWMHRGWG